MDPVGTEGDPESHVKGGNVSRNPGPLSQPRLQNSERQPTGLNAHQVGAVETWQTTIFPLDLPVCRLSGFGGRLCHLHLSDERGEE